MNPEQLLQQHPEALPWGIILAAVGVAVGIVIGLRTRRAQVEVEPTPTRPYCGMDECGSQIDYLCGSGLCASCCREFCDRRCGKGARPQAEPEADLDSPAS